MQEPASSINISIPRLTMLNTLHSTLNSTLFINFFFILVSCYCCASRGWLRRRAKPTGKSNTKRWQTGCSEEKTGSSIPILGCCFTPSTSTAFYHLFISSSYYSASCTTCLFKPSFDISLESRLLYTFRTGQNSPCNFDPPLNFTTQHNSVKYNTK